MAEGNGEVFRKIIEPSPDLLQYARALLGALRWDGVAHLGFFVEILLAKPVFSEVVTGLIPRIHGMEGLYMAIAILGATVMPSGCIVVM